MLTRLAGVVGAAVVGAAVVLASLALPVAAAHAAPPGCERTDENGQCVVIDPGDDGGGGHDGSGGTPGGSTGSGGATVCKRLNGDTVPCSNESWGYWVQRMDGWCKLAVPQPPPNMPVWQGHTTGAIYQCSGFGSTNTGQTWFPGSPGGPTMTPEEAAKAIVETMDFQAIEIGIVPEPGPNRLGYVGLPVWMWTDPTTTTWGPQSKTATAGGRSVSLTAEVSKVVWSMGNGDSVTCTTPGTEYQDRFGRQESPSCGYPGYQKMSTGYPGNAYPITARSYWTVQWTSDGASGTIPLDFIARTSIRVGELQAIVTGSGAGKPQGE